MNEAATTDEVKRIRFKMGEDIPEWLIVLNPMSPQATRNAWRWATDIDVIDCPDYFLVMPISYLDPNPRIIDDEGTYHNEAVAASKPVWICHARSVMFATKDELGQIGRGWAKATPPEVDRLGIDMAAVLQASRPAMPLRPPYPPPGRSFWQKLKDLFS